MSILNNTYFEEHAHELLTRAKLNKAQFAEKMGVARQNIQKVFETKNIVTLQRAASVLGVPLELLILGKIDKCINGYIEINDVIYPMNEYFFLILPKAPMALSPVFLPIAISQTIKAKPKVMEKITYTNKKIPPPYLAERYGNLHILPRPTALDADAKIKPTLPEKLLLFSILTPLKTAVISIMPQNLYNINTNFAQLLQIVGFHKTITKNSQNFSEKVYISYLQGNNFCDILFL